MTDNIISLVPKTTSEPNEDAVELAQGNDHV
jgi:hypothetical protein